MPKNVITINGTRIEIEGNNVSIVNGIVTVDGVIISTVPSGVEIHWKGDLASLTTDSSVICDNVQGDVDAGGSVNCDNVKGSVTAGGSVNCDDVGGSVSAGGSVIHG